LRILTVYGDIFGEKVLGNLLNHSTFCESCGLACAHCRSEYPSFAEDIVDAMNLPTKLPPFLEDPSIYYPQHIRDCDLIMAIGLHPDLLTYLPEIVMRTGAEAVIVPIENRSWCPSGLRKQLEDRLDDLGIERAFPKPFCSLDEDHGTIGDFCRTYRLGRPKLEVFVDNDTVTGTFVRRSAPCGSTWYVAQQIRWHRTRGLEDIIAKAHHSYPCTASMEVDPEVGDALLHVAGYLIRDAIFEAIHEEKNAERLLACVR
jgi:hypothetical protein